jgi:hypothetical protein
MTTILYFFFFQPVGGTPFRTGTLTGDYPSGGNLTGGFPSGGNLTGGFPSGGNLTGG